MLVPTVRRLWRNRKQVSKYSDNFLELNAGIAPENNLPADSNAAKFLALCEAFEARGAAIDDFDLSDLGFIKLSDIEVVYAFDRQYKVVNYPVFDKKALLTANCYVYSYDQRRENIRKLGKPALVYRHHSSLNI